MIKSFTYFIFLFFIVSTTLNAHGKHLGKINFVNTGSQAAQSSFAEGMMLLHSFEYDQARLAFQEAQKIDPHFALAYWGEAMSYNHTLWSEQDREAALKALVKFDPSPDARIRKAQSAKEKGLMNAINVLYGFGNKKTRDSAYADAMRELYKQNPNDDEIASLYALALLGTTEGERDFRTYMQAAGIVDEIYSRNPFHPGALHYAIHAYDDPIHAPLGLRSAKTYAKIAPDASHALHMPSHIFMALGMWDEVILSNQSAWNAGIEQNPKGIAKLFTIDDLHALHWLSYGYLQKCDFATAFKLVKEMEKIAIEANTSMAKWYYALMRAAYIIESKSYHADLIAVNLNGIELTARASDIYVNALIALHDSNITKARKFLDELSKALSVERKRKDSYNNYFTSITKTGLYLTKIIALELKAHIARYENKDSDIAFLQAASQLENKMSFGYGPPIPISPTYELLGQRLLQVKDDEAAYRAFVMALKRNPNRHDALQGLREAGLRLKQRGLALPEIISPYFNKLMLPEYYH